MVDFGLSVWLESSLSKSNDSSRIPTTASEFCFSSLVIFSYEPNVENYFRENYFF
jgi:hypothetical protein